MKSAKVKPYYNKSECSEFCWSHVMLYNVCWDAPVHDVLKMQLKIAQLNVYTFVLKWKLPQ